MISPSHMWEPLLVSSHPQEAISVMPVSPDRGRDSNQPDKYNIFSSAQQVRVLSWFKIYFYYIYNSFSDEHCDIHCDIAACLGYVYVCYLK